MLSARVAARAGLRNLAVPRSVAVGGLRTYAAPAAQQDVRPPVALYGVDGTYANALVCAPILPSLADHNCAVAERPTERHQKKECILTGYD